MKKRIKMTVPSNMPEKLQRRLGFKDAFFFELGGVIGSGVFVLIGLATGLSGPAIVLSVVLAGIISFITALSYAEISSAIPAEGGEYAFANRLVSQKAGLLVGSGLLCADVASSSLVALSFASYLNHLLPQVPLHVAAWAAIILVTSINLLGVKLSARMNSIISAVKVGVLALFIAVGLTQFHATNFADLMPKGAGGVVAGAALFFFAFSGFGKVTRLSEEVKDAKKNVPNAILSALAVSTTLYVLTALTLVGAVGWIMASSNNSPLASAMAAIGQPGLAVIIALGALAATSSVLLTNNAGISRVLYAVGRQNKPLQTLTDLHRQFKTPYKAILLVGIASFAISTFTEVKGIASAASFLLLLYYASVNGIVIWARLHRKDWKPKFRTPLFPWVPLLGILFSIVLLASLAFLPQ